MTYCGIEVSELMATERYWIVPPVYKEIQGHRIYCPQKYLTQYVEGKWKLQKKCNCFEIKQKWLFMRKVVFVTTVNFAQLCIKPLYIEVHLILVSFWKAIFFLKFCCHVFLKKKCLECVKADIYHLRLHSYINWTDRHMQK